MVEATAATAAATCVRMFEEGGRAKRERWKKKKNEVGTNPKREVVEGKSKKIIINGLVHGRAGGGVLRGAEHLMKRTAFWRVRIAISATYASSSLTSPLLSASHFACGQRWETKRTRIKEGVEIDRREVS